MNKMKDNNIVPWFSLGDIGGIAYVVPNNVINYMIVVATLSGVLQWPDELVYGIIIPGMSVGLFAGCIYYSYLARKLSKQTGRTDVTALPSGVSGPAMFVILYGVIVPLDYALGDPYLAWSAAVAATFIGGFIEFLGGFIGPWMKNHIPRAALLGTLAGIGFIWMATLGLFEIYAQPMIGIPVMVVAILGIFGGYLFPKKIPPMAVAIVGGIVYALVLGVSTPDFSGIAFYCPDAVTGVQGLLNGFAIVAPYLTIIIPVEIYNFVETMDNVEAAHASGDMYNVREALFADGICTMLSACFGGVIPNTVWLGHGGLKKTDAGLGFSWVSGILQLAMGCFGLLALLNSLIPMSVISITFTWCAATMMAQAFKACNPKHYAAIILAMVPPVGDFLYSQVTGSVGLAGYWAEVQPDGITAFGADVTQQIVDAGVMWNGVPEIHAGAIVTGIFLGTMLTFVIDRRLDKAALVMVVAAVLAAFGFVHSAALGFYFTSPYVISYLIAAALFYIFHLGTGKWLLPQDDFDCV